MFLAFGRADYALVAPGAEGWVKYRVGNSDHMIIVHFRCPFGGGDDEAYWEPSTLQGFKLGAAKNSSNPLYGQYIMLLGDVIATGLG